MEDEPSVPPGSEQQTPDQRVSVNFNVNILEGENNDGDSYDESLRMRNRPERSNFSLNHVRSIRKAFEIFDWCSYLRSETAIHAAGINREHIYSIINSGGFHPHPPTPRNSFSKYILDSKEQEIVNDFVMASGPVEVKPSMYTKSSPPRSMSEANTQMTNKAPSRSVDNLFNTFRTHSKRFLLNSQTETVPDLTPLDRLSEVEQKMNRWRKELVGIQMESPEELSAEDLEAKAEEIAARVVPPTPGLPYDFFMEYVLIPHFELFFPVLDSQASPSESDASNLDPSFRGGKSSFSLASKGRTATGNNNSSARNIGTSFGTSPPISIGTTSRSYQQCGKEKNDSKRDTSAPINTEANCALVGNSEKQPSLKGLYQQHRESNVDATELLFSMLDANADGLVSWEDFSNFILQQGQRQLLEGELRAATKKTRNGDDKKEAGQAAESLIRYGINFESAPRNRNLWQETYPLVSYLYHTDPITKMVCSTRSSKYITASSDGNVKMWRSDKTLADEEGRGAIAHERNILSVRAPITDIILSPSSLGNSELVGVAAMDGTISLLRAHSGELVRTLLGIRQTKDEEVYAFSQLTKKRSSSRRRACSARYNTARAMGRPSDEKDSTSQEAPLVPTPPPRPANEPITTPVLVTPSLIRADEHGASAIPQDGAGGGATYIAPNSSSGKASSDSGLATLQRYKYTINAYKKDALEIFFGKASKYFKGLDVVPPTYEHLKRPGTLAPDVLYSFGFGKRMPNSKFSRPSTSWFASSLALEKYPDFGVYSTLRPGAYMFLGFESGVLQVYGLNENWFTTTQQSATRVEPSAAREPLFASQIQDCGITSILISVPQDFIFFAGTDGTVGVRNFSKLHIPLNCLGAPSMKPSAGLGDGTQRRRPFTSRSVGHTKRITCICWNESCGLLVTGSADHCVAFWTPRSSARPMRIVDLRDLHQRTTGIGGASDGENQIGAAATRACGYPVDISFISRQDDPLGVLILDNRRFIRILDVSSGHCVSLLSDAMSISSGSKNAKRLESGGENRIERQLESSLRVVRYDPEEDRLILGGKFPRVWNIRTVDSFSKDYIGHRKPVICMDYTASLELWVTADVEHIVLWKLTFDRKSNLTHENSSILSRVESGAYSKNFSRILEKGPFNITKGEAVTRLVRTWTVEGGIRSLAIDRDGRAAHVYVALMLENAIVQYNSYNGTALRRLAFPTDAQDIYCLNAAEALLSKAEAVPSPFVCAAFDSNSTYGKGTTAVYHVSFPGTTGAANSDKKQKGGNSANQPVENIYSPTEPRRVLFSDFGASSVALIPHLGVILIGSFRALHTTPISDATSRPIPCRTLTDDLGSYMRSHRESLKRRSISLADTSNESHSDGHQRRRYLAFFPGRLLDFGVSGGDKDLRGMGESDPRSFPSNAGRSKRSTLRSIRKSSVSSTTTIGNNNTYNNNNSDTEFISATERSLLGFLDNLCPVAETGYLFSGSNHGLLQLWSLRSYSEVIRFFVTPYGEGITALEFLASQFLSRLRLSNDSRHCKRHKKVTNKEKKNLPGEVKASADGENNSYNLDGKYLLCVGDEHGHVLVLDFNAFEWNNVSKPLDVSSKTLEEDVVVLARWRAHRGYVASTRFVVGNSHFPTPPPLVHGSAYSNSPYAQQFCLCTSGEDAFTYVWSWNRGSLSCLSCFGAGAQTPALPPILNIHPSTIRALEQMRRRYIQEHLINEENFFSGLQPLDELQRAMEFILLEQRQLIQCDATWSLAEIYQIVLENFAFPFLAERRKARSNKPSSSSSGADRRRSTSTSLATSGFRHDDIGSTPGTKRPSDSFPGIVAATFSPRTPSDPLAFAFCPNTFVEEENESVPDILRSLVVERLESIAQANRKKNRSVISIESESPGTSPRLKSSGVTPLRLPGSPTQSNGSPTMQSPCQVLNGLFTSPVDQEKHFPSRPPELLPVGSPLFPASTIPITTSTSPATNTAAGAALLEKSPVSPFRDPASPRGGDAGMQHTSPLGRSHLDAPLPSASLSTTSRRSRSRSDGSIASRIVSDEEARDLCSHGGEGETMEGMSLGSAPLSHVSPRTPAASTSAPTSRGRTGGSLPGQIQFRGTDGLPLYKAPLNESLALAHATYMITEKEAVESHHYKTDESFVYIPDEKAPLAIINPYFKRPQDEGFTSSPTMCPATSFSPSKRILLSAADSPRVGTQNALTSVEKEASAGGGDDSDEELKDAADVILKASRERRRELGGPQCIAQCQPYQHPKFVARISINSKRASTHRRKGKKKRRKGHSKKSKAPGAEDGEKSPDSRLSLLSAAGGTKELRTSPFEFAIGYHRPNDSFSNYLEHESSQTSLNQNDSEALHHKHAALLYSSDLRVHPFDARATKEAQSEALEQADEPDCGPPPYVEHSMAGHRQNDVSPNCAENDFAVATSTEEEVLSPLVCNGPLIGFSPESMPGVIPVNEGHETHAPKTETNVQLKFKGGVSSADSSVSSSQKSSEESRVSSVPSSSSSSLDEGDSEYIVEVQEHKRRVLEKERALWMPSRIMLTLMNWESPFLHPSQAPVPPSLGKDKFLQEGALTRLESAQKEENESSLFFKLNLPRLVAPKLVVKGVRTKKVSHPERNAPSASRRTSAHSTRGSDRSPNEFTPPTTATGMICFPDHGMYTRLRPKKPTRTEVNFSALVSGEVKGMKARIEESLKQREHLVAEASRRDDSFSTPVTPSESSGLPSREKLPKKRPTKSASAHRKEVAAAELSSDDGLNQEEELWPPSSTTPKEDASLPLLSIPKQKGPQSLVRIQTLSERHQKAKRILSAQYKQKGVTS